MGNTKIKNLIYVTLLALGLSTFAQETIPGQGDGGMSDGGGCLIKVPGQSPQLMDLVYTNTPAPAYERGDQITLTGKQKTLAATLGMTEIKVGDLRSYRRAVELVGRWTKRNDLWAEYIASALKGMENMPVNVTNFVFLLRNSPLCSLTPKTASGATMTPLAIFKSDIGLVLSIPDFNSLDLAQQAAVWVHESIRLIQILNKQTVAPTTMVGITSEIISGRVSAETLQSHYPLEGKLKSFAGQRDGLKADGIRICEKQFKGAAQAALKQQYCPILKSTGMTKELAQQLEHDLAVLDSAIADRAWDHGYSDADKKTLHQITDTKIAVLDWLEEWAFLKLQELDDSPELASLLFAMKRINGNLYYGVTMEMVAEVAEDGSSHMLNREGNRAVREWIKSMQNMWRQMERNGSIQIPGGLKPVKTPSTQAGGGKSGNNK